MPITINNDCTTLKISGATIAAAARCEDGQWNVTGWSCRLRRDQATIALIVTEMLETGHASCDPVVAALLAEVLS